MQPQLHANQRENFNARLSAGTSKISTLNFGNHANLVREMMAPNLARSWLKLAIAILEFVWAKLKFLFLPPDDKIVYSIIISIG